MEADMVQVLPARKLNGKTPHTWNTKRVAASYTQHGRKATLKRYRGLTDPTLYAILHAEGVPLKTRRRTHGKGAGADSRPTRRGSKGSKTAGPRGPYKRAGAARRGAGIGDALTYLAHARDRARQLGEAGETVLGLLALAEEALGG